jgi:ComF family protein
MVRSAAGALARVLLDFALPPRCAGCGVIVGEVHSFCPSCWNQVLFLGDGGCSTCGVPLDSTEAKTCARCLAAPPLIARIRAAVAYDDIPKSIALRLKYGRKVALAKTMARFMAPLAGTLPANAILVPVPLHRRRLWTRGFNQAALVAGDLSKRLNLQTDGAVLERTKATPPLKGMSLSQRKRTVQGAFRVSPNVDLRGRTIVLIDDVLTTGSTSEACARALRKAGAERVELISWARVLRPAQIEM